MEESDRFNSELHDPDLPDWEMWNERPVITVLQAVALSFGINPERVSSARIDSLAEGEIWSKGVKRRLDTIESWSKQPVTAGGLMIDKDWVGSTIDRQGDFLEYAAVNVSDFVAFCDQRKWELPKEFRKGAGALKLDVWPWGSYTSPALELLRAAAQEFWVGWDVDKPMPENKKVSGYLRDHHPGFSENAIDSVVLILRPVTKTAQRKAKRKTFGRK